MKLFGILLICAALALAGCGKSKEMEKTPALPGVVVKGEPATTATGLQYYDMKVGTGDSPQQGQICIMHYTGWLMDGKKFDSSLDKGQPFEFTLGAGRVIKGWEEGIASMKIGGQRKLVIKPELGWGERGAGGGLIPPNSTTVFDVELLGVK